MKILDKLLMINGYAWITVEFSDGSLHKYKRSRWCWMLANKRGIPKGYVIHHKDRNKLNDNPNNLELLSRLQHSVEHAKDNSKKQSGLNNSVGKPDVDTDQLIELLNYGLRINNKPASRAIKDELNCFPLKRFLKVRKAKIKPKL